jgi:N-acetylglutamate synthase-like GNAT family acetyltransferase
LFNKLFFVRQVVIRSTTIGENVVNAASSLSSTLYQEQDIEARLVEALTERLKSMGIKTIWVILSTNDSLMEAFFSRLNVHRRPFETVPELV